MRLKKMLFIFVILVYVVITASALGIFNNMYYKTIKQKYLTANKESADTVEKYIKVKLNSNLLVAKNIAGNKTTVFLLRTGKLIDIETEQAEPVVMKEISALGYTTYLSNTKNQMFGSKDHSGEVIRDLAFYDDNFKVIGKTGKKEALNQEEKDYLAYLVAKDATDVDTSYEAAYIVKNENQEFTIKGISNIKDHDGVYGCVSCREALNFLVLNEIKGITGKDLVIMTTDDNIVDSSLHNENGDKIAGIKIAKSKIKDFPSYETVINGNKLALNMVNIVNFKNETIGYVGVVLNYSEIDNMYKASMKSVLFWNSVISLLILLSAYLVIRMIFKSMDQMDLTLKKIAKGYYEIKLTNTFIVELNMFIKSINILSESVKDRESSLALSNEQLKISNQKLDEFNRNLEAKVEERTAELKETQDKLVQVEKVAALGIMAGGIAHEINSPLAGILTAAQLMDGEIESIADEEVRKSIGESVNLIKDGARQSTKAIKELLDYIERHKKEMNIQIDLELGDELYTNGNALKDLLDFTLKK